MGFAAIAGALVASQLVTRVGTRPVHAVAAVISVVGLLLLSRAGASGSYVTELLPGLVLFGAGITGDRRARPRSWPSPRSATRTPAPSRASSTPATRSAARSGLAVISTLLDVA